MKALIFHARAWDFQGKDGGQVIGNSVSYLEDMMPISEPNESGLSPMSVPAEDAALAEILKAKLPALFDIEIGRRAGRFGKPASVLVQAKFLSSVPVAALLGSGGK